MAFFKFRRLVRIIMGTGRHSQRDCLEIGLMARSIDQLPITVSTFKNTKQNYRIIFKHKICLLYIY